MADWQMLSTHGRVLVALTRDPDARLRDIADATDLTERTVHRVVTDLVDGGYVVRRREGRRNRYRVQPETPLQDPLLGEQWVGELLVVLTGARPAGS